VPAAFDAAIDLHGTAPDDFRVVVGTNYKAAAAHVRTLLWHVHGGVITDETPLFLSQFSGDVANEKARRVWVFASGRLWLITDQTQLSTSNTVSKLYELDGASTTALGGSALDGSTLNRLYPVSDSDVYLGGAAAAMPLLLHYDGNTFTRITLPNAKFAESVLAISALSASEVYVLTSSGRLLKGSGSQFTEVATIPSATSNTFSLVATLGSVDLLEWADLGNSVVQWTGAALHPECVPTSDGLVDYLTTFTTGSLVAARSDELWVKTNSGWQSLPRVPAPNAAVWGSGTETTYAFVPDGHVHGNGAAYRLP
jgi:hypothetical protein